MKKILLLLIMFCAVQVANAQLLKVEKCHTHQGKHRIDNMFGKDEYLDRDYSTIKLSNGDVLSIKVDPFCSKWWWVVTPTGVNYSSKCRCYLDPKVKYPKGTLVYKYQSSNVSCYDLMNMEEVGFYVIESCEVCEIDVDMRAQVDYAQESFLKYAFGADVRNGSKNGKSEANNHKITVVNVIFDHGEAVSIVVEKDPIWKKVKAGQQVKQYRVLNFNIYELVFS